MHDIAVPTQTDFDSVHSVIAALPDPTISCDSSGIVTGWNPAAAERMGRSEIDAVGRPLGRLLDSAQHDIVDAILATVASGGTVREVDLHVDVAAERRVVLALSAAPLRDRLARRGV